MSIFFFVVGLEIKREMTSGHLASLKKASKTLDRLLAAKAVDVDAVVADFKSARQRAKASK